MHHKDANQSVKDSADAPQGCVSYGHWLGSADALQGCKLGWALLLRHRDANQSVKATWLGSADAPQEHANQSGKATWLGFALRHKDVNQSEKKGHLAGLCFAPQGCKPVRKTGPLGWARHKDANQSVISYSES